MPVLDLKLDYPQTLPNFGRGYQIYVHRQTHFFSGDGLFPKTHLQAMCKPLPWESENQKLYVSRSIPMHGICSTDIQREFAGHRSLPKGTAQQALSHGHPRGHSPQHSCECQQNSRLANICRSCSIVDYYCSRSLYQRGSWPRSRQHSLRTRRINHRSVFVSISVGYFSANESSGQITYSIGSARQHTNFYPYNRWQSTRRQRSRYPYSRTRRLLHNGSRVCRLQSPLHNAQHGSVLPDSCKIQYPVQTALLTQNRHFDRCDMRPNNTADRDKNFCGLPSSIASSKIPRYSNRKNFQFFNQQFYNPSSNSSRSVQTALAGRIIFQMDKTASPNQVILRNIGECGQITNLDRCVRLCAHRDHKKTTWN